MVIVFVFMIFRDHRFINVREVFKQWILFAGLTMTFTAVMFELIVPAILLRSGFEYEQVKLVLICNNFIRILGVSFVLIWAIVFHAFVVAGNIDLWIKRRYRKKIME